MRSAEIRADLMYSKTTALRGLGRLGDAVNWFEATRAYALKNKCEVTLSSLNEYSKPGNEFDDKSYPELKAARIINQRRGQTLQDKAVYGLGFLGLLIFAYGMFRLIRHRRHLD